MDGLLRQKASWTFLHLVVLNAANRMGRTEERLVAQHPCVFYLYFQDSLATLIKRPAAPETVCSVLLHFFVIPRIASSILTELIFQLIQRIYHPQQTKPSPSLIPLMIHSVVRHI